ncbi:DUF3298 and DUF4163 domain-containing protein [Mucilaginibacter ginkgonis]|uniref:DUF3298 and DUF4163 domain-containing protein n=1 Tax=Mucilaginibacter ginkgonis TaxID=2682091 RepID=A0A6I4HWM4_9SPHI|nr:DUF3298 and DUF4163 domain-containing protein [Mucilaginibacter ginkgonis]QQL51275.1 DUF3298 and DUF4163 domain-containing protein [Mucilaginibacter ginkgonis]
MKNPITFLLAAASLLLYACGGKVRNPTHPDVARDTLAYSYKTLKQRADDCGDKPDSTCTVIKIIYPEFRSAPILNDTLKRRLVSFAYLQEKPDTSFSSSADKFMKAYKDDIKTTGRKDMFYTAQTTATVIRQDSALTTIEIKSYQYTGGAHGSSSTTFLNWNTKTHKELKLADVLVEGYLPKLNAVAEKIFRKSENLTDTSSLARDYFFKDAKFSVNNNFLITPVGIRFLYNEYEIKPYAAGQTDLFVPYTKIKGLLKPNTVTSQYLH